MKYYLIKDTEIHECYCLMEGFLPVQKYNILKEANELTSQRISENIINEHSDLEEEDIYTDMFVAISDCKLRVEYNYKEDLKNLLKNKRETLEYLNKYEQNHKN